MPCRKRIVLRTGSLGSEPLDKIAQPLKLSADDLPLSGTVTGLLTPMTKKASKTWRSDPRSSSMHD
jgi:hypothetical protein